MQSCTGAARPSPPAFGPPALPPLLQTKYLLTEAPLNAPITLRVAAGAALWLAGWLINLQADHILINLRRPGEKGKGPRGECSRL